MNSKLVYQLLLVISVMYFLAVLASVFPIMMSPMLFDAGENAAVWLIFISLLFFPVACIVALVLAWYYYRKQQLALSLKVILLPWLSIVVGIIIGFVLA